MGPGDAEAADAGRSRAAALALLVIAGSVQPAACAAGENMVQQNDSCSAEQVPMSFLTCLLYALEGWTVVEHLNYVAFLLWLFSPLLVAFILPGLVLIVIYVNIIILHIYKRRTDLKEAYSNDFWDGAKQVLATIWHGHARIWNGYEVHGLENIPDGPALIVFYHGATPMDFFYLMAIVNIKKKRRLHVVADHFVFSLPGFKLLLDVLEVLHGTQEECVRALKDGHLLGIAPGGVREALFSNENYSLMWGNRKGFAQVAIDAKVVSDISTDVPALQQSMVHALIAMGGRTDLSMHFSCFPIREQLGNITLMPIIPMFTQNVREGIRTLGGLRLLRIIYENFRLPIVPLYGNFPVKLRTYIGDPIPYEPNVTADELAEKAKNAVQSLIDKHQKIPGNVFRALMERFNISGKKD